MAAAVLPRAPLFSDQRVLFAVGGARVEARTRAVSRWAAVAGGAALISLLVTGTLLESAFAVNVVLAVIAIAGTIGFVPESAHPDVPGLDGVGALLAMAGLTALVFSLIEAPEAGWGSARTLGGIGAGLAILAVFVVWEFRAAHPGAQRAVLPQPAAAGREPVDLHPVLRSSAAPSSCCSACRACVATAHWLRRCRCCRWRRR